MIISIKGVVGEKRYQPADTAAGQGVKSGLISSRQEWNNGCGIGRKRYRDAGNVAQEKIDNIFFGGEVFFS